MNNTAADHYAFVELKPLNRYTPWISVRKNGVWVANYADADKARAMSEALVVAGLTVDWIAR